MANSILSNRNTSTPNMLSQFRAFRNAFQGNPQQMVQQMLQSGKISEAQLQQAVNAARQFQHLIK